VFFDTALTIGDFKRYQWADARRNTENTMQGGIPVKRR
jgi:hypothetical protein